MIQPVDIILLCGGKGSRFHEITKDEIPKSLYVLNDIELIQFTIDGLDFSLVNSLIFAVDHHADAVQAWVQKQHFPCAVRFSTQTQPGVLSAVRSALQYVTTPDFIVCNTDEVREGLSQEQTLQTHSANPQNQATMTIAYSNYLSQHRVVMIDDNYKVTATELRDPKYKDQDDLVQEINVGFVVFRKTAVHFFDELYGKDWGAMIDPLVAHRLMGVAFNPDLHYFNVGTPQELDQARSYLLEKTRHPVSYRR